MSGRERPLAIIDEFQSQNDTGASGQESAGNTHSLFWYGKAIGEFSFDEDGKVVWGKFLDEKCENFFTTRRNDGTPQFLANLIPDSNVFETLNQMKQEEYISAGLRFLSNFRIVEGKADGLCEQFWAQYVDQIYGRLEDYRDEDGLFNGSYAGPIPLDFKEGTLNEFAAQCWQDRRLPRFSGMEVKIPVHLSHEGRISLASDNSFTHILKFPVEGLQAPWGVNEWMCMQLSEAAGLKTAESALVDLGVGEWPAYLVERFDIGTKDEQDPNVFLLEQDFCTLCSKYPDQRMYGSLEEISKAVRSVSSDWEADAEALLKRTILSWLVNDEDMHRKNMGMLFRYNNQTGQALGEFAPTFDVTSEIHKVPDESQTVLTIGGKIKLNKKLLVKFGEQSLGFPPEKTQNIINEMCRDVTARALELWENPPSIAEANKQSLHCIGRIATITCERSKTLGFEPPGMEPVDRIKFPNNLQRKAENSLEPEGMISSHIQKSLANVDGLDR